MAGRGDEALLRADVPAITSFLRYQSQNVDHRDIGAKQSFVAFR